MSSACTTVRARPMRPAERRVRDVDPQGMVQTFPKTLVVRDVQGWPSPIPEYTELSARAERCDQGMGIRIPVEVEIRFVLRRGATREVVWEDVIASRWTGRLRDAIDGNARQQKTVERAVRENIRLHLDRLSVLGL